MFFTQGTLSCKHIAILAISTHNRVRDVIWPSHAQSMRLADDPEVAYMSRIHELTHGSFYLRHFGRAVTDPQLS